MNRSRRRWIFGLAGVTAVALAAVAARAARPGAEDLSLAARAERGDFTVTVNVTGTLRARSSVNIPPPANTCSVGACQIKIASILPEGTVVKQGDTVIELDRSPIVTYTNNTNLAYQKAQAVAEQAELDTTLNLSKAREDLRNAKLALEERRIGREQAQYEAPSIRRQAEIDYEKAERALAQQEVDYETRVSQAKAKMREVNADLQRNLNSLQMIQDVSAQFSVRAPADGMLIYARDYSGKKRAAGAMLYFGEAALAELPDLRSMMSFTYVNEVDIRKISVGQRVSLTLDSDPSKRLTGSVMEVANIGEERPNTDGKVFEVKIGITESDTTLRPGMTTANAIEVLSLRDVLSVPVEAVSAEGTTPFVYKRTGSGLVKQEVRTGPLNDTHVVITDGLSDNDVVLLVQPARPETLAMQRLTPSDDASAAAAGSATAGASSGAAAGTSAGAPVSAAPATETPAVEKPTPPGSPR